LTDNKENHDEEIVSLFEDARQELAKVDEDAKERKKILSKN